MTKIKNKQSINELQARLSLRLGRKISQQDTLDLCVRYSTDHFEDILQMASSTPMLSPEKAECIIQKFEKYANTPYRAKENFDSDVDNDLYSV